ncbi:hypothetical protein CCS41_14520 (plasmid) [Candidatus Fukatsuia symbiotica]|uniref:Uncharacterized protein n=1 Tax=Candidatus Fukatsuia symbiotica TaxID=1878942 RepID=A0A2U8IBB8_9GAMM|nr:hypothetical protein CCS41_14520 [Candidatus Fukatsuia symbiotica]
MTASSHMSKNNPIDESRVKADVALQRTVSKDEAMKNFMTNKEKEEIKVVVPPPTEPSDVTVSTASKNTPPIPAIQTVHLLFRSYRMGVFSPLFRVFSRRD